MMKKNYQSNIASNINEAKTVKNFYYKTREKLNQRMGIWELYGSNKTTYKEWIAAKVKDAINSSGSETKFLDAGCGTGEIFSLIVNDIELNEASGIDISEAMIRSTKEKLKTVKKVKLRVAEIENLPYVDNYFDVVLVSCVLHHVKDIITALKDIYRVTKHGGKLLIATSDFNVTEGLNTIHYELLKELGFPEFMLDTKEYTRFTKENAEELIKNNFGSYAVEKYVNNLDFTSADAVIEYYSGAMMYRNSTGPSDDRIAPELWMKLEKAYKQRVIEHFQTKKIFHHPGGIRLFVIEKK